MPKNQGRILKIIHARAPIRINDIGGWTDTWFAGEGKVLNLAVSPAVEVQVKVFENRTRVKKRVLVHAENFAETFAMDPDEPRKDKHPLLQFTIGSLPVPRDAALEISLYSPVPAGISTGTSASVCVVLLGALRSLASGGFSRAGIARLAHRVETEKLGQQSGIQDQIAAAHGGISFIHMRRYPQATVRPVRLEKGIWNELDRRICLVYLGKPHRSSAMHEHVIAGLEAGGPQLRLIRKLTSVAQRAGDALAAGDFTAYGEAMIENNEYQRALFAGLVSGDADAVAAVARRCGAAGWKVNGAGGKGGSMTVLAGGDDVLRRRMIEKINALGRGIRIIPVSLSRTGLQAWTARTD